MREQWIKFATKWVECRHLATAYLHAYPDCDPSAAVNCGSRMMRYPEVKMLINQLIEKQLENLAIDTDYVLAKYKEIVEADPQELIEIRRDNCRYCHGDHHRYQYTMAEWEKLMSEWQASVEDAQASGRRPLDVPDYQGGVGYDRRREPHPDCPECRGEGVKEVIPKDTRELSKAGRALYAGVKITRQGIEIKMQDKMKAIEALARHLGMFTDNVNHKNDGGSFEPMSLKQFYGKPPTDIEPVSE